MTIFCLFSIMNEYNQPNNNLAAWWKEKPTIEQLKKSFDDQTDDHDDKYQQLLDGLEIRFTGDYTDYRLEEVNEAQWLKG